MPKHNPTLCEESLEHRTRQYQDLNGAVQDYLNALAAPSHLNAGSLETCEAHLERLAALVGMTYRNPRPAVAGGPCACPECEAQEKGEKPDA